MPKPEFYHSGNEANRWWANEVGLHASWNAEFIQQTEFRKSERQEAFVLRCDENEQLEWSQLDITNKPYQYIPKSSRFKMIEVKLAKGCQWWFDVSPIDIYEQFAKQLDLSLTRTSERLGEIRLRAEKDDQIIEWVWHNQLGVFQQENN